MSMMPDPQRALDDHVNWVHQPAFDKAFADLTGTEPENDEWRREVRWNFTADDVSFIDVRIISSGGANHTDAQP